MHRFRLIQYRPILQNIIRQIMDQNLSTIYYAYIDNTFQVIIFHNIKNAMQGSNALKSKFYSLQDFIVNFIHIFILALG